MEENRKVSSFFKMIISGNGRKKCNIHVNSKRRVEHGYMIESGFSSKNIKTQKICISRSAEYKFIWFSGDYLMLFMQFQLKSKQRLIHIVRYPSHSLTLFDSIFKKAKWYSDILCNVFIAVVFSVLLCCFIPVYFSFQI